MQSNFSSLLKSLELVSADILILVPYLLYCKLFFAFVFSELPAVKAQGKWQHY